jgi:hypothetical protein
LHGAGAGLQLALAQMSCVVSMTPTSRPAGSSSPSATARRSSCPWALGGHHGLGGFEIAGGVEARRFGLAASQQGQGQQQTGVLTAGRAKGSVHGKSGLEVSDLVGRARRWSRYTT